MIGKFKTFIKQNNNFIITLLSSTLITLFIVIFIFSNTTKYEEPFKEIINKINILNLSLEDCSDDLSLNTSKSINILTNNIFILEELKLNLQQIEASSQEKQLIKEYLDNLLSSTIKLYDFCLLIINNPSEITSGEQLYEFNSIKEQYINNYSILTNANISLALSDRTLLFFDNIHNYINNSIKVNRDSEIQSSQHRNFLNQLSLFLPTLDDLTQDLMPAIKKVHEENRNIQVILDDISLKEDKFSDLRNALSSLSIPDGSMEFYKSLQDFLKIYDAYIAAIKEAVLYDKSYSDNPKYSSEIEKKYDNSTSKYEDSIDSYSNFKKLINNS